MRSPRKVFRLVVWSDGSYGFYTPEQFRLISPKDYVSSRKVRKSYKLDCGVAVPTNYTARVES